MIDKKALAKLRKEDNKPGRIKRDKARIQELWDNKEWYTIRSLLGNQWAHWFFLIGARERGKSYSVQDYCLYQKIVKDVPFYWVRLNEASTKEMLQNNGAKMFEPLLVQKWNLTVKTKADEVYNDKTKLCDVFALSTAHNLKGSALYDAKTFKGCNIIVDEMMFEQSQRRTFSPLYQLKMLVENICRSHYENVRIFLIANNTEECSEILAEGFNFIPLEWGVFKLKSKNPAQCAVVDYIPNNKAYEERRKTSFANALEKYSQTGNFTNKIQRDISLIYKGRLHKPLYIIKFSKDSREWFTVWDNNVICEYNGERKEGIAMRRHIDELFTSDMQAGIIEQYDARAFKYRNLITQTRFKTAIASIKKQ